MILIIDKSLKNAATISDIFHYMGIVSGISAPERAVNEISNRYHAILIPSPERIPAHEELIRSLRTYSLGAPIFALTSNISDPGFDVTLFDKVFDNNSTSSSVAVSILKYQDSRVMKFIGNYLLAGIDASIFQNSVTYFDIPISFTKTETMILRYLISAYPNRAKAEDILKYAFKFENKPEITNIRTHISSINKKFNNLTGRNLIFSEARLGYIIACTADSPYAKKEAITK
ncbi:MAG: helix-turn-helix domain-containing protein [Clostridia bacterium]|nr:helix-turn-helix domain-containing protein [Clostridia bacterium]